MDALLSKDIAVEQGVQPLKAFLLVLTRVPYVYVPWSTRCAPYSRGALWWHWLSLTSMRWRPPALRFLGGRDLELLQGGVCRGQAHASLHNVVPSLAMRLRLARISSSPSRRCVFALDGLHYHCRNARRLACIVTIPSGCARSLILNRTRTSTTAPYLALRLWVLITARQACRYSTRGVFGAYRT